MIINYTFYTKHLIIITARSLTLKHFARYYFSTQVSKVVLHE